MNILTDDEIESIRLTCANEFAAQVRNGEKPKTFARAIEAAVLQKLAQGVSSESACNVSPYEVNHIYWNAGHAEAGCNSPLFTELQLTAAIAAARVQAINECADLITPPKVIRRIDGKAYSTAMNLAGSIRALIGVNHG